MRMMVVIVLGVKKWGSFVLFKFYFQPRSTCGPIHSLGMLTHYYINFHDL